jgi:hypothetical protein
MLAGHRPWGAAAVLAALHGLGGLGPLLGTGPAWAVGGFSAGPTLLGVGWAVALGVRGAASARPGCPDG